jgi:UDP-N-acetylmuramoyl-L-alanyl-D-glutamate--2,6-diaminopimelate ligase
VPGYPRPASVPPTPLSDLAAQVGATLRGEPAGVTGVTHASQDVRPGDLYAALPGSRVHGAQFAAEAVAAGAVAVFTDPAGAGPAAATGVPVLVVDDPRAALGEVAAAVYGRPSERLTILGVTGTAGKTSTVYLLESGLRAAGIPAGLIGTVETRFDDLAVDSARTTPEATDLQSLFAAALERGIRAVAMEVSSHALKLGRVEGVRFSVGGFTNFGVDHLDFHPDVEDYFAAKARLFDGRSAVEVVNADDRAATPLLHPGSVTYSAAGNPAATWRAADVSGSGYEQHFTALGPDGVKVAAGVGLPGRHNVANALLAIAMLSATGIDAQIAADGVAACPGVPGRLERVGADGPVLGVVDYAHKPDAIAAVLTALREIAGRNRLICVLGAGGDRDRGKRARMGAVAATGSDLLIVTDDNPRTEDPAAIRAEVLAGAGSGPYIVEIADRRSAIAAAVARSGPGDVVAVLGKGHERGQEVGTEVYPFDDRVELAAALAAGGAR